MISAKQLIDIIQPKHTRTSCSDKDLNNGFYSSSHYTRCLRCTLLQILKEGHKPESHFLNADFQIEPKIAKEEERK